MLIENLKSSRIALNKAILKRKEKSLDLFFFYNAMTKKGWHCNIAIGVVISSLDGSLTVDEVFQVLSSNSEDLSFEEISNYFLPLFNHLLDEEFLVYVD